MSKYRNLFIDLDDTLWDTYHNNRQSLEDVFNAHHYDAHYGTFEAFFAVYWPNNVELWHKYENGEINKQQLILNRLAIVLNPMGITSESGILEINREFLFQTTTKKLLIDGAIDLLEYLRPRYRLFILSNGFHEVQMKKLENSGLAPYFDKVILSEDAAFNKPQKGIFDYALRSTNSRKQESLMIGDAWTSDISGAKNAHIDQLWFNPKHLQPKDTSSPPTYTVYKLQEIKTIL